MQPQNPYPPPHDPDAPAGQPPYAPPPQAAPPPYAGQPPYAAAPAPYLAQTEAAREARERKGKRDIGFGVVWMTAGLLITGFTMASGSSVVLVAWGPVLYGIYLIIRGAIAVSRSRR